MKKYESYKNANLAWVEEIPKSWNLLKIGRTFSNIGSGTTPKSTDARFYENGTVNWLNTGDLNDDYIYKTKKKVTSFVVESNSTLKLHSKDSIVIALYGATIGKLGHLKIEATTNQACCVLSNSDKVIQRFLFYYFLATREFIISKSYGGGQPNISQELIKQLYIPSPSIKEQIQIANYLDHKTTLIDTLIEKKEQLIKKLQAQRQAIINEAVTKGLNKNAPLKDSGIEWLGEIPEHWEVCKIKHLAELKSGDFISANNIEPEGKYPVFGGNGLRGYTNNYTHEGSYVLIGRQGAYCGNIKYARNIFWATEHAVVCTFKTIMNLDYFGELLRSMNLNQYNESAAQPGLAVGKIENLNIPKTPIDEQNEIARFIKGKISLSQSLVAKTMLQIKKLKYYRQSIISEAVTGKIDVRDWQAPKK
jgi:type I restriction enzyme S subunit